MTGDGLDAKSARELMDGVPRLNRFRTVDELEDALMRKLEEIRSLVEIVMV